MCIFDPRCANSEKPRKINIDPHIARRGHFQRLAFAQRCKGHGTMTLGAPLPDRRSPVKARAVRDRLRRLTAALTALHRSGPWAAMRSWLPASEIAPVAEVAA
jgi:hypothetical protein